MLQDGHEEMFMVPVGGTALRVRPAVLLYGGEFPGLTLDAVVQF